MAAELPVLDIRRQDKAPRLELDPDVVKPRPFLSHARTGSSLSSSSSSRSTVTEESLWPASTSEDARISISSTAYSGSSVMSHSNIYGVVLEGGSDRTSFIDLSTTTTTTTTTTKMSNECSPSEGSRARSPKPPIPTTPKPDFGNRSVPNLQQRPPTTNYLKADERADLIRKSRKLAQVFGQTPGAGVMPQQDSWVSFLDLPLGRHLRGTASVSTTPPVWPPPEGTQYLTAYGRRHSTPLTPDRSSCEYMIQVRSQEGEPSTDDQPKGEDTKSFIDLSEEELPDDISAIISNSAPRKDRSPSPSLFQFEHLSPEEQAEELRRRNRDKLAKLHRFLGSRIPADLVLGFEDPSLSLPPPLDIQMDSPDDRKAWLKRRRSSSVAAFPHWSDDHDRVKEDLNDKEKAINVRRAQKMEKMFGVAPPQTLYHTRHGSTPMASPPASPKNMNQSPYKLKSRKDDRTGSSESLTHLLGGDEDTSSRTRLRGRSGSLVYTHYQHSLNSLVDIIDRDDRESLAELHEYLNSNGNESPSPPLKDFTLTRDRRTSIASIKSERRRSLPTRTSMTSLASEYSISATLASPKPEVTDFQLRRRRAAKLTNFFGVDYRDLIRDVLDSIENGLEHERKRGTINPEEAEVLLQKLREIKTKRDGIF
ncbi:hypothetical protein EV421DRAFT_1895107 [Armillaria borealis]|uniref:Uncharacterized protein n=1 Tax=Armillaria borealis TaxID=47425 RepID=A0AA39K762_9AGAR|nr:hypothetical protein EV421DRAFT_1895107 [Armillaria borealis]